MNLEMRQKLARESFEEKIRKVGQLICLSRGFPKAARSAGFAKEPTEFVGKAAKFFNANVK
jgi:hypothetical protein